MDIQKRIQNSETRVFKVVFPKVMNHHHTMFGGAIMETMVEVAFITATRFARKPFVIKSTENSNFKRPIPEHALVEFIGKIESVGITSVKVRVEAYSEEMYSDERELCADGYFILVALNDDKKPTKVLD